MVLAWSAFGSTLIQSSVKFGPTTSSATSARPMCEPKLRTPGIARSSLLALLGDPPHRLERRAGLLDPVHQEVGLLKVGQELLAQPR